MELLPWVLGGPRGNPGRITPDLIASLDQAGLQVGWGPLGSQARHNRFPAPINVKRPGLRPQRLADIINERKLYTKKDEGPVGANGIQARVSNYSSMFVRENGLVRLRGPQEPMDGNGTRSDD